MPLPCFLVHGFVHDQTPVNVQDPLAHVDVLLQEKLYVVGWLQKEHIAGVGDENLERNDYEFTQVQ